MIENPSDQLYGYAEEATDTIEKISQKYNCDKAFSLLIVQTSIESMKLDCEQHKMIVFSERLSEVKDMLFDILRIIEVKK